MAKQDTKVLADREECKVYRLGKIIYVPHYLSATAFVGPGYPRNQGQVWSEQEMIMAGAKPEVMMLWSRPKNDQMRAAA